MRTPPVAVAAMLLFLSACSGGSSGESSAVCGDAVRSDREQCDDGNTANLDGCDASCRFEQVLRANHLALEFAPTATCTANAFGGAVTSSISQQLFSSALEGAVQSGYVGWLLWIRDLDDLSGVSDAAVEVGVLSADLHVASTLMFDGARDFWFVADPETLDADRLPRGRLGGALSGGVLSAGPGPVPLPLSLLGELALLDVVGARISLRATGLSAPTLSSGGEPPGHLPSVRLSPELRSFDSASEGELCGALGARSLAAVPIPGALAEPCGYPSDRSFLDLLVGGCGALSAPTQPDRVDPAAPVLGAGGPYQLSFDAGAQAVTGCQDALGVLVDLDGCLRAAAYSSAFTFTAVRAIVRPGCGDGDVGAGEECEDGNVASGDGCSNVCTVEAGWTCTGNPSVCTTPCGDGDIDAGELCDDGNRFDLDGCSSTCAIEEGYACEGVPSVCTGACGDGLPVASEECDDGNTFPGDGCSGACVHEPGFYCEGVPTYCVTFCGDAQVAGVEQCDDGNGDDGDGCDRSCQVEPGWSCTGFQSTCTTACGDGIPAGAETCDDANEVPADGCTSCSVDPGWTCTGSPSVCTDFCLACDDAVACTVDSCNLQSLTCEHVPNDALCDDGEPCTVGMCDGGSGCVQTPVADATPCEAVGGAPGSCRDGGCAPL